MAVGLVFVVDFRLLPSIFPHSEMAISIEGKRLSPLVNATFFIFLLCLHNEKSIPEGAL